ncbi:MAG: hypothetical protein U5L03_01875 [Burkholderiaceae bacterium]|nr:hypothetical protein [Burkholderiaceae bacterium]
MLSKKCLTVVAMTAISPEAYADHHSVPIVASSLSALDAEGQRVIALDM